MAKKTNSRNPYAFTPVILDQENHDKRRVIKQLPVVHQTETLQKFFGASADHLFDPGKGKSINGYVGQKPLWYDPDQDYYLEEDGADRTFYQLEASMVSKSVEGQLTDLLPYSDLINQLRFQGALVNNHDRLFSQSYYSWCPPIDLDKVVNFRQYVWLQSGSNEITAPLTITGPSRSLIAQGDTTTYALPGYEDGANMRTRDFYDLALLKSSLIHATVDGVDRSFTYTPGSQTITFSATPALDSVVIISVYSDVENNAIDLPVSSPLAFGGVQLSSGMRIKLNQDKTIDYQPSDIWIVEGVGTSIRLLREESNSLATPDYLVMARGAANRNEWSTGNRWYHVSTLPQDADADHILANRATRPIVEFNVDLELYQYGLRRRLDVDLVVQDIEDLNGYMNANPQDITLDGIRVTTASGGKIHVQATDPRTGAAYGDLSSIRVLVRGTINSLLNDKILVLVNQSGSLKLILETDGENPSGDPVHGEVSKILLGTLGGQNLFWNGSRWTISQSKTHANQAPLFEVYDLDGNSLADVGLYPGSTFQGNQLFSYKQDTTGTRIADPVLGISLVHDNKGQILFENYLNTSKVRYLVGGQLEDITGFYFHKIGDIRPELEVLSNDWYLVDQPTKQYVIDRYVADGRSRNFAISQDTNDVTVSIGRVNDSKSFEKIILVQDRDFIRVDREILIFDVRVEDIVEIKSHSTTNPPLDATGHFEIPLNLQANPDNQEVTSLTKGDFYDHFSEILRRQVGFQGAEYSSNNYRDTAKAPNLGSHIIQHSSGLLKTMLLASQTSLDIMSAIRYSDAEYGRFKDKFQRKILDYSARGKLSSATSNDVWINAALDELNKGKTRHFPYYLSGMAQNDANRLPTFIPPTPSFLGVYVLYEPDLINQMVGDETNSESLWFVRGHDGSLTRGENETCARVLFALEQRIFDSVPASIRTRERPITDWQTSYGDQFRTNQYSYDEYLRILRPTFERWTIGYRLDGKVNDTYDAADPWTWNWSSLTTQQANRAPGHWRGIYEKFFGTQRPDLTPWESLGFTIKPLWWDDRYGSAPYTSENLVLWDDLERGFIFRGPRQGINASWARPGLQAHIPVDLRGRLRHPGPRNLVALEEPTSDLFYLGDNQPEDYYVAWEDSHDEGVLGCGILTSIPLPQERSSEWTWGDLSPVEQEWRRSSAFGFAVAQAAYLMNPSKFVELGWNTKDLELFFPNTPSEQFLNQDTRGRPSHGELQVHGEILDDLTLVTKVGIQQWISDYLASSNTGINDNFAKKVRGLGSQLSYKVGGFTDSSTLVVVSDAFGRVPSEDVTVSLYRSPSVREETYSGVAVQYTGRGYEVFGYDAINPSFLTLAAASSGNQISVGSGAKSAALPVWQKNTYYSVNLTLKYQGKFYRCLKTHTSSTVFEDEFWVEVARPQYADGASLTWYLDADSEATPQQVPYGTVFKTPQQVADFFNAYERYLVSRGWSFSEIASGDQDVRDWRQALASFIIWSNSSDRKVGDYLTLSPSSSLVRFTAERGAIQPVEQIVNGLYAIVDQNGQPIDAQKTRVVRSDGDISISCSDNGSGIFGLRLYVSELEHVLVFNNQTIFGDTIYSPLLNIHQPRLRLQGFKTVGWKGRIDAPGFIVTGDTLTPNFERAADDFRRFFDAESMENKRLQDRARANFGYEEREYLNNLLLTPTNQFEFYQGMIQQKGSTTAMRRLLRSNFIRHNKGLKLFEEWAFRVGDYGGQEVSPSLDVQIRQSEFLHNPQLISFDQLATGQQATDAYGTIQITDYVDDGVVTTFDPRWHWRPDMSNITWPVRDFNQGDAPLPTAGYVKLDEVRFTVPTTAAFENFYGEQASTSDPLVDRDRVWVYGIGDKTSQGLNDLSTWSTYKFNDTGYSVLNTFLGQREDQGAIVQLDATVRGYQNLNSDPDTFYISQLSEDRLILRNLQGSDLSPLATYRPKFKNTARSTLTWNSSVSDFIMGFAPQSLMVIRGIRVIVDEAFAAGSTFELGTELDPDYFVGLRVDETREIYPTNYDGEAVLVQSPDSSYVAGDVATADIALIRVGRVVNFCAETFVEWTWVRASDGFVETGTLNFIRPSDYDSSYSFDVSYLQNLSVTLLPGPVTSGTLTVKTNGTQTDSKVLNIVRANSQGLNFVDLTRPATYSFDAAHGFAKYPFDTNLAGAARSMLTKLINNGTTGSLRVEVDYMYGRGFELQQVDLDTTLPVLVNEGGGTAQLYCWLKTRYPTLASVPTDPNLWDNGDLIEVDSAAYDVGRWSVYRRAGTSWVEVRHQNRKINSDLLTSAALFDDEQSKLKLVLQLYDPYKGFIPGNADRELSYKTLEDPATYGDGRLVWSRDQVGQLWWDLSKVRYLDYEISDDLTGGVNYRWKNWGRIAPLSSVDIMEWTRSPVQPSGWNAYVASRANLKIDAKPSGVVDDYENLQFISATEWNDDIQQDELVYYFWVKNPTVVSSLPDRRLSARQVSNIIGNPIANDIPYFAVIDGNKVIVGGIKQFLSETDTVLKIKWSKDAEIHNNHHKQWIILREEDERNTIQDTLWNKMRDSLVGWDTFHDDQGVLSPKSVPDERLPKNQQIGSLIRPRQSWFPAQSSPSGGQRANRSAREAYVDIMNAIMAEQPFIDQWYDWQAVFNKGEDQPTEDQYVLTALDLEDLANLLPASRNMVQLNDKVLVPSTSEASGFWTLWKLVEINGVRTFILDDFQKWRMREGELWNLTDWYASGWSAKNFPNYRFPNPAARDAAGNLDFTLLRGTLVQLDTQNALDGRWSWDVYTSNSKYQVAKGASTFKLSSAFYDDSRVEFGPRQINALLNTSVASRITPDRILELNQLISQRDGSREIQHLIDSMRVVLFDTIQRNRLFFSIVKSAFRQSKVVDWAFKTSFLYLGGYSEVLRQSPVAFKDQIDNVISYLEEVKPYHVKIREYVRRLSYGPDLANLAATDFDKPVYPDGTANRVLDPQNTTDQNILNLSRPWKDWYANYTKLNYNLKNWDAGWNPVRRSKISIKFDRISCGSIRGWDTSPWDPDLLVYSQLGGQTRSLGTLSALYRNRTTDGNPNYYRDQAVETIEDRNYLVRRGAVTTDRPGTIVKVLQDDTSFMWSGSEWIQFESVGWDRDPDQGTATRISDSYNPLPGMIRKDDPGLIAGCDFQGTVITSAFQSDEWDVFEWDSTGYGSGLQELTGQDVDVIDGSTKPQDEAPAEYIGITGNKFSQPRVNGNRPHELIEIRGNESLIINVRKITGDFQKSSMNAIGHWETLPITGTNATFVAWDQTAHTLSMSVTNWTEDSKGFTPLHDPQNPSMGFVRDVMVSRGYRSTSNVDMTVPGTKTFKLRDIVAGDVIPSGLMGDNVRVVVINPKDPSKRAVGVLNNTKGAEAQWNGSLQVTFTDGFVYLGSGKNWNIIPVDSFNSPGVVWIGNARFTYTALDRVGNNVTLKNAYLSANTLAPLTITDTSVTLKTTSPVYDGSIHRRKT